MTPPIKSISSKPTPSAKKEEQSTDLCGKRNSESAKAASCVNMVLTSLERRGAPHHVGKPARWPDRSVWTVTCHKGLGSKSLPRDNNKEI